MPSIDAVLPNCPVREPAPWISLIRLVTVSAIVHVCDCGTRSPFDAFSLTV